MRSPSAYTKRGGANNKADLNYNNPLLLLLLFFEDSPPQADGVSVDKGLILKSPLAPLFQSGEI